MIYNVATASNLLELRGLVNEMIASGWELQGGVCVAKTHTAVGDAGDRHYIKSETVYAQAMVKPE